jgi:hypothetical protein
LVILLAPVFYIKIAFLLAPSRGISVAELGAFWRARFVRPENAQKNVALASSVR